MRNNVLSYHGKPELKAWAVAAAKRHRDQDRLLAGTYGEVLDDGFHGCSVGCDAYEIMGMIARNPHNTTADYFGFPEWLEHLRDRLFERLPEPDRYDFHAQLKAAIPVGVDLEPTHHKLAIRRMDRLIALQRENIGYDTTAVIAAIEEVKACHEAALAGKSCDWKAAESAAWAAGSAGRSRARSAAESAESAESAAWAAQSAAQSARSAAESAESAESAAWAARSAARSARSAAESAARSARSAAESAYQQERDNLLAILRELDQEKAND